MTICMLRMRSFIFQTSIGELNRSSGSLKSWASEEIAVIHGFAGTGPRLRRDRSTASPGQVHSFAGTGRRASPGQVARNRSEIAVIGESQFIVSQGRLNRLQENVHQETG